MKINKKLKKFTTSNQILSQQVKSLIQEKIKSNVNTSLNKNSVIKYSNNTKKEMPLEQEFDMSQVVINFFNKNAKISKKPKSDIKSKQIQPRQSRLSQSLSLKVQKEKDSYVDQMINSSISNKNSLLDISTRSKRRQSHSKDDSVLKYEDFVKNRPSDVNFNISINASNDSIKKNRESLVEKLMSNKKVSPIKLDKKPMILIKQKTFSSIKKTDSVFGTNTSENVRNTTISKISPIIKPSAAKPKNKINVFSLDDKVKKKKIEVDFAHEKYRNNYCNNNFDFIDETQEIIEIESEIKIIDNQNNKLQLPNIKDEINSSINFNNSSAKSSKNNLDKSVIDLDMDFENCENIDEFSDSNLNKNNIANYNLAVSVNIRNMSKKITKPENEESVLKNYDTIINKYLFEPLIDQNEQSLNASLNSKISKLDKDLDTISQGKKEMKTIATYYKLEEIKLQNQLKNVKLNQSTEITKINEKLEEMKEKIKRDASPRRPSELDHLTMEYQTLKNSFKSKENNYKSEINNLLSEWKNNNSEEFNESLLKDINEILEHENNENQKLKQDDDSMIEELKDFRNENVDNYKFEIPLKYQISKNTKIQYEETRKDGKVLRFLENSVVEVVSKKNNLTRLFPDGYTVTFYANKDIKQNFNKMKTIFLYSTNKSIEFNYKNEGFKAFKFRNGQFEKHFFDGRKYIKFADGSIKILRPNGEELTEFTDRTIQRKDKFGNIFKL